MATPNEKSKGERRKRFARSPKPSHGTAQPLSPVATPTPATPAVARVVAEPTGRCRVDLPAGFVAIEEKTDTWYSTDRSIAVTLVAPESAANPSLKAAMAATRPLRRR